MELVVGEDQSVDLVIHAIFDEGLISFRPHNLDVTATYDWEDYGGFQTKHTGVPTRYLSVDFMSQFLRAADLLGTYKSDVVMKGGLSGHSFSLRTRAHDQSAQVACAVPGYSEPSPICFEVLANAPNLTDEEYREYLQRSFTAPNKDSFPYSVVYFGITFDYDALGMEHPEGPYDQIFK